MSSRMIAPDRGCRGATVGRSGRSYDADKRGFVHVDDPKDAKLLRQVGYVEVVGSTPRSAGWVCECGWEALINSCPRCKRTDLTRVAS